MKVHIVEPDEPYDASIPVGSNDGTYAQFRYIKYCIIYIYYINSILQQYILYSRYDYAHLYFLYIFLDISLTLTILAP